jgi:hypothetical protein
MPRKRTVAVATSVSAALVASATAFAIANGILGSPPTDRVGTYHVLEQQLAPAYAVAPTLTAPPTSVATTLRPAASTSPTTHSTANSVPNHERDDDGHGTEPNDGRDRDD